MIIRLAKPDDAIRLSELNRFFNKITIEPSAIAEKLKTGNEVVVVSEENNQVTGFGCAQVMNSFCYNTATAELTELYVDAPYRGKGAAQKIISKIEQILRKQGAGMIRLETACHNKAARAFYEKQGYILDDEVAYFKQLSQSVSEHS